MLSDSHKYFHLAAIFFIHIYDHFCILCLQNIRPGTSLSIHACIYIYVGICMCAHTYIHVVLPTSMHPCIHIYIPAYIHPSIHTDSCMPVYIHPCAHILYACTHKHACLPKYILYTYRERKRRDSWLIYVCLHTCIQILTYIHAYMYTYIRYMHTYIYAYLHIHVCLPA